MSGPVLPGGTVGLVGGGQLGRMFALEARRMGYRVLVWDPSPDAPAVQVADAALVAPFGDGGAARELARRADVVTLEWENADLATVEAMAAEVPVRPGPGVLAVAQHRVREKDEARRLGVGTAEYRAVATRADLDAALAEVGTPAVLKTARLGYDGKGQAVVRTPADADAAFAAVAPAGHGELILEAWVPFRMEVSVVVARGVDGAMAAFPAGENVHRNAVLDVTVVPARVEPAVARRAREVAEAVAEGLGLVGLLGVELFVTDDGRVLLNEIAPRPHNSGHYTWEACAVSQFEQQLRAVCGLPLGDPSLLRPAAMANLMGDDFGTGSGNPGTAAALAVPGAALHIYGKHEARPGRKMGHVTALGDTADEALSRALAARAALTGG